MGKPKKNNTTSVKEDVKKIEFLGKKVQYVGLLGARFSCTWCKRSFKKGMVSEFKGNLFCNEDCIKASLK